MFIYTYTSSMYTLCLSSLMTKKSKFKAQWGAVENVGVGSYLGSDRSS